MIKSEKMEKPPDDDPHGKSTTEEGAPRKVMVIVVPLEPSPFVVPESSYDFTLPLFGGTIPRSSK